MVTRDWFTDNMERFGSELDEWEVDRLAAWRFPLRRRADIRTLAFHLAVALDHIRCCDFIRLTSSGSSWDSSSLNSWDLFAFFSKSFSDILSLFLLHVTHPMMKKAIITASTRDSTRIMAVDIRSSSVVVFQPRGSEDVSILISSVLVVVVGICVAETWSSTAGTEVSCGTLGH